MDRTRNDGRRLTIGEWRRLRARDPQSAGRVLDRLSRLAVRRIPQWAMEGEEAAQEVAFRTLDRDCAALRRARDPGTPLLAWLRACAWNVFKEKEKEKEKTSVERVDVIDPAPGPLARAQGHEEAQRALATLASLPPPYGFVLYLQSVEGKNHAEIHAALRVHRRVGRDRVDQMIREGHEMCRAFEGREDLRRKWPLRFERKKNPWFATPLPPIRPPSM
jgi:DNA-directed RNA polymerase specialized sigma24 family protein